MNVPKASVVICYYQQAHLWPLVVHGLDANKDQIADIFLINDGPLPAEERQILEAIKPMAPLTILDFPSKSGFNVARCANRGLEAATSDYVLLIEGDETLAPGSLQLTLAHGGANVLVAAPKKYLSKHSTYDNPQFIGDDHRASFVGSPTQTNRPWWFCSGGHLLIPYTRLRFDESYQYGCHDYDFAFRWLAAGGWLRYGGGAVWHIGTGQGRKTPINSRARFAAVIAEHRNGRYHIGCGDTYRADMVNIDMMSDSAADVLLDCHNLSWIKPKSAELIYVTPRYTKTGALPLQQILHTAKRALRDGGQLVFEFRSGQTLSPDRLQLLRQYTDISELTAASPNQIQITIDSWPSEEPHS